MNNLFKKILLSCLVIGHHTTFPLLIIDGNRDLKESPHSGDIAIKEIETFIAATLNS